LSLFGNWRNVSVSPTALEEGELFMMTRTGPLEEIERGKEFYDLFKMTRGPFPRLKFKSS
jgi:hypothetical protein